jgi:Cu/Ag efflux pump CusA
VRFIIANSLRFRYLVVGAAAALMFFGLQTLGRQKVDVFPEFAPVTVEIQTECTGLSPGEVQSLVTVPLENALQGVPGVDEVESESVPELSAIFLYFKGGTDVLQARQLVQERLATAASTLPSWASPPAMYPIVSATSRVLQIGLTSKTLSPLDLSTIATYKIRPRLLHVPGVANVAIWGNRTKGIEVQADPSQMVANRVSLNQLMAASADAVDAGQLTFTSGNAIGTGGFLETPNQRLNVRNIQVITTPRQLAEAPLVRRGARTLTVGNVARVQNGAPPLIGDAVINGGPGLLLVVEKFPGANTLHVTRGVDRALAAMAPGLRGIQIDSHIFRQASFIRTAISNLAFAVLLGCILVVFVLIAFLFQWRAAFVSLLAIPLSLAAAALVLDAEGTTINTMVLAGFAVAVGVVVDDAIIDMENIVRRLRLWRAGGRRTTPLRLLLAASLEVRTAILYATLINIVAVLPVVFVGGLTGSFFRPLALAYALAVLASMVVALTVTPALAMILMPSARLTAGDPPVVRTSKRAYTALLTPVLRHPRWALAAVAASLAAGVLVVPNVGEDLFPSFKEPDLLMHFDTKPGTSLTEMTRLVTRLQQRLLAIPGVTHVGAHIGQALLGEEIAGPEFSEQWITLAPGTDVAKTEAAVRAVEASFPGTFTDLTTYLHERIDETISTSSEDLVVRVVGPDFNTLQHLASVISDKLKGTPNLVDLHPQSEGYIPQVQETVDTAAAARYELTPGAVRRDAAALLGSVEVGQILANGVPLEVRSFSVPTTRRNLTDVSRLLIDTPGGHVPLGRVASLTVNSTPSDITRVNGSSKIDVLANVSSSDLDGVRQAVLSRLAHVRLPLGYHVELLGEAAERQTAETRLLEMGVAAAVAILLLLQVAFGSVKLALLMFATLPGRARRWCAGGVGGRRHDLARRADRLLHGAGDRGPQRDPADQPLPALGARRRRVVRDGARDSRGVRASLADPDDSPGNGTGADPARRVRRTARSGDRKPDGDRDPRRACHVDAAEPVRAAGAVSTDRWQASSAREHDRERPVLEPVALGVGREALRERSEVAIQQGVGFGVGGPRREQVLAEARLGERAHECAVGTAIRGSVMVGPPLLEVWVGHRIRPALDQLERRLQRSVLTLERRARLRRRSRVDRQDVAVHRASVEHAGGDQLVGDLTHRAHQLPCRHARTIRCARRIGADRLHHEPSAGREVRSPRGQERDPIGGGLRGQRRARLAGGLAEIEGAGQHDVGLIAQPVRR